MSNERSTKISHHLDPEGYYRVEVRGYGRLYPKVASITPSLEYEVQVEVDLDFTPLALFPVCFEVILKGEYINELEFEHRVIERVEREEN